MKAEKEGVHQLDAARLAWMGDIDGTPQLPC